MKLRKDWEYFRDIDEKGRLKPGDRPVWRTASQIFADVVLTERFRDVIIEAKSFLATSEREAEKQIEAQFRNKINKIEKTVWHECVDNFIKEDPDRIGQFPKEEYLLYTLSSEKDPENQYEVKLRCKQRIQEHKDPWLAKMWMEKKEYEKQDRQRRNLRLAAFLAVIHFLLNAATTLSILPGYEFLYFGRVDCEKWSLFVAGILLVARLCHRSRTTWPGIGVLLMAGTVFVQYVWSGFTLADLREDVLLAGFHILICGAANLAGLVGAVRFILDACKAPRTKEDWRGWAAVMESGAVNAHKKIRFLALWYRDMTGKTCENLQQQEKLLQKCLACANRRKS